MRAPMRPAVVLLLLLGLLRMAGDAFGSFELFGLGFASAASPAPKVFTVVGDMEPFANRFAVAWTDGDATVEVPLTPEIYARLGGPYNRRNAYGAVLAAAPALLDNATTAPMCRSVLRHALSGDAPLLRELEIEAPPDASVRLLYRHPSRPLPGDVPRHVLEVIAVEVEP